MAVGSGMRDDARSLGSRWIWVVLGGLSAGYLSLLSHSLNLFVPALIVLWLIFRPEPLFEGLLPHWFAAIFMLLVTVGASAIMGTHGGLRALGFALFSMLPLLGLALSPSPQLREPFLDFMIAAALGMVVWILVFFGFLGGNPGPWQTWTPAGSGNLYGVYLNMLWPVLYFAARTETDRDRAKALYVLALICLIVAILTFSRAAIVSSAISILLIIWRTKGLRALLMTAAAAATFVLLAYDQTVAVLRYARLLGFNPDLGRFRIWTVSLQSISQNPLFGVAPGGAKYELASIDVYHAHNSWLNMALESGAPAGALFILITIALAFHAIRLILRGGAATGFGCAIAAYLSSSMVATTTSNPELTLALVLMVTVSRLPEVQARVSPG